jgi:putative tryptophan/tyrosine transport system substrate-binding protein
MRRRDFINLLGCAASAWPFASRAQRSGKRWIIGLLDQSRPEAGRVRLWDAFRLRLRELGYVESDNITFEPRWADGRADRLPGLAAELVKLKVDVIAAASNPAAQAAKRATSTIPIVMATASEAVGAGIITSLSRPGGNVTGVVTLVSELAPKRLELLREMIPQLSRVATLVDAGNSASTLSERETELAAQALGISLQVLSVRGPEEFDSVFELMLRPRVAALIIQPSALFFGERSRLASLAKKHGIPTMDEEKAYTEAGGLISYGPDFADNFRRAAEYVDKILKGAKPAGLPVQQPTKFELVVNLKTAKALGIIIPQSLLLRADEVIQ